MKAPLPADEAARLDALHEYRILDTLPEAAYDDLTRLASHLCGTPVALITLIDRDRQWFKSSVGFDVAETSRDVAFCAHTILKPELVVVPDARDDARFADNPFVTEAPHVRFYAGAPLVTPAGHALGTLCVIDDHPRDLDPEQRSALRALARQVMTQLELRRHVAELEAAVAHRDRVEREMREGAEQSARYAAVLLELARAEEDAEPRAALGRIARVDAHALGVGRVGIWLFSGDGGELVCQDLYLAGEDRHEAGSTLRAEHLPGYFRALRERRAIAARDALADPATREFADDYLRPLGITSMLDVPVWRGGRMVGVVCHEHTGPPRAWTLDEQEFAASIADLTARALESAERKGAEEASRVSETRFRTMFEQFPFSIQIFDPSGRSLEVNRAWERLFGMTPEQVQGFNPMEDPELAPVRALLERGFAGEALTVLPHPFVPPPEREADETHARTPRWLEVSVCPVRDGETIREVILVHQDVTARHRAEEALRASEESYRTIFQHSGDAIWLHDLETGELLDVNQAGCEMFGYTAEEQKAMGHDVLLYPGSPYTRERVFEYMARAAAGETPRFEWMGRHRDGGPVWGEITLRRVTIGGEDRILASVRDIRERKAAEAALRRANEELELRVEERTAELVMLNEALEEEVAEHEAAREELQERTRELEGIFHALPDLYFRLEDDGRIVDHRAGAEWALFAPPSGFIGRRMQEVLPPEVGEQVQNAFDEVRRTGALCCIEYVLPIAGAPRSFEARIVPLSDGEMISVTRDITDRKQAEDALQEREEHFRRLIENASDMIAIIEPDGTLRYHGGAIERLYGYRPDENVGSSTWERVHPEDLESVQRVLRRVVENPGRTDTVEFRFRAKDGTYHVVEAIGKTLGDDPSQGVVVNSRDVTERQRATEALQHAKEEAEQANRAKSEFLSRMSHELRTPMNSILGFAQLLARKELPPDQRKGVEHILKAGRHLLNLINEVLDISRIEANRQQFSLEPVRVSGALQEAASLIRPLAAQLDCRIEDLPSLDGDPYVRADRQRLAQVLLNLLSNAVKYNRPGGSVHLSCDPAPGGDRLRIRVHDTGRGIPPERMDELFVPFARLGAEQSEVEGTGLGLALSKRLVEAMDGTLGVESVPGQGSTFWIEFPRAENPLERTALPARNAGEADDAPRDAATVLYIEDNLANLSLIENILAVRPEITLLTALQGRIGLDLAWEHHPELVLLDLHLPDLSGAEVLRRLRADARTRETPVLVISADATEGSIERLMQAGARGYLTKPLDVDKFLGTLDEILAERRR